jgi:cell division protein FtsB
MSEKETPKRRAADKLRHLAVLSEAQLFFGWLVVLVALALLGTIYLQQSSRVATLGRQIQAMQSELRKIKRENAVLEGEIAAAQSLERLESEAVRLGFQRARPDDIEYVTIVNYPAGQDTAPLPTPTPMPAPLESVGEALWYALRNSVNDLQRGESP